jgi:1-acyl-sn-glycerol-3-phosphate acyltransferase
MWLYHILQPVVRCLIRIYHRARVEGLDRVPAEGPLILVGNHLSLLDPFYIGAFFPRKIRFMAKKESFRHPVARFFLEHFRAFPVDRGKADLTSLKTAIGVLRDGEVLGMFPAGGRRETAPMRELKQGAAYLALKTGTPIVPVYIEGTDKSLPRDAVWIRPHRIRIVVGECIEPPVKGTGRHSEEQISEEILRAWRRMAGEGREDSRRHG